MLSGHKAGCGRIPLLQGEAKVSADRTVVFSTVLGSCVASCLYDPVAGIGGMNHFLLAEPPSGEQPDDSHYGAYLMELLVRQMLAAGACKSRLVAHLYGGANLRPGMGAIGTANARFALAFLDREQIGLLRSDLGGTHARRVEFRPVAGQVRCRRVDHPDGPNGLDALRQRLVKP